jgi:hypothetical protein
MVRIENIAGSDREFELWIKFFLVFYSINIV